MRHLAKDSPLVGRQVHFYVSGRVQGVGYRQFVKSRAKKLGLTGWVQNLPEGRVEVVAQGAKDRLEMLLHDANRGSFLSEVEDVTVTWEETTENFTEFTIRHLS